ncbi:MAG: VWA domain-containing protein [Myxococcales bacterium]|nr:MAG: VWA domain-containing protein [Myxococcales bacterium]
MRFAVGEYAFLFLLVPFLALVYWSARRRTVARLRKLADPRLGDWLARHVSDRKAILKAAFVFAAVVFIVAALMQPQVGGRSTLVKREGIDLMFALDVSKSMEAKDIRPSRLKRAQLELQALIEELHGDRVGVISFAGVSFLQCPMTTDYAAAKMFLKAVSSDEMPVQGTAIGPALTLAHKLLTEGETPSGSRMVVLLTDGEDHGEELDKAVAALSEARIPVFVVGIGSMSGEPIPEYDKGGAMLGYHKAKDGQTVMSRLDESRLKRISEKTGGRYVNLQAGGSLTELHDFVKKLQKQEFESSLYTQYDEKFAWLLWPAFVFLLFASFVDERRGSRWLGVRS